MQQSFNGLIRGMLLSAAFAVAAPAGAMSIEDAVDAKHRDQNNTVRDAYRNPVETLEFFGLEPQMTVVEMTPGAGWYSEIIGAVVAEKGKLYAAQGPYNGVPAYQYRNLGKFMSMIGANHDIYKGIEMTTFSPPYQLDIAPKGSADMVLTFRNLHNWIGAQQTDGFSGRLAFKVMYDSLKPGGVLGIVDHRWPEDKDRAEGLKKGYMHESEAIRMAEEVGFKFVGKSEVNANPDDTKDYPRGVWTLPPTFAMGAENRDRYQAIGESDRFTLKFVKPAN